MQFPTFKYETDKHENGFTLVAGCDEVGIAPLAGPVVAAVVILDRDSVNGRRTKSKWWHRVRDSKTVCEKERGVLVDFIKEHCVAHALGIVSHETIDQINIYNATMSAMKQALFSLSVKPEFLFIDGKHRIKDLFDVKQQAVVDGDAKILSISAASIIAKVARDKIMNELHQTHPQYNFHLNKGYPTKFHREALVKHGACSVHRRSFGLVQQTFQQQLALSL
ncbi:MAG: ribonuclease HII [Candidatus Doudnabacteria bacterium]|nr:ribonuclease HII [Candidatus Doudnabacteria bacterium]